MKSTVTKCDNCGVLSKDSEEGKKCSVCDGGIMQYDSVIGKIVKIEKALTTFDITEKVLSELEESTSLVITDTESEKVVRKFRQQTKGLQVNVEKKRKSLNSTFKKTTDENAKLLRDRLDPVYEDLDEKIKAVEKIAADKKAEKDRIQAEKDRIDKERLDNINLLVSDIENVCLSGLEYNKKSELIKVDLDLLKTWEISSIIFQEKTEDAEMVRSNGISNIEKALAARILHEDEQAKLAKQREEQAETDRTLTIEKAIILLKHDLFFNYGISIGVLKAHKKILENTKLDILIYQERSDEAKEILKTAVKDVSNALDIAINQDNEKTKIKTSKAEIATKKQADEGKKALAIQIEKDHVAALLEDAEFDKKIKAQLKKDKAHAKFLKQDQKSIQNHINNLDKIISEVKWPLKQESKTNEGGKILIALYSSLNESLKDAETKCQELV